MIYTLRAPWSVGARFARPILSFPLPLSLTSPFPFPLIRPCPRTRGLAIFLPLSWTRVMRRYTGFMGIFMRIYRAWSRRCPRRGYTGPVRGPKAYRVETRTRIGPSCTPAPNLCRATNSSVFHAAFLLTLRATRRHGHHRGTCVHIGEVAWFPLILCYYEAILRGLEDRLFDRRGRLIFLDHGLVVG